MLHAGHTVKKWHRVQGKGLSVHTWHAQDPSPRDRLEESRRVQDTVHTLETLHRVQDTRHCKEQ